MLVAQRRGRSLVRGCGQQRHLVATHSKSGLGKYVIFNVELVVLGGMHCRNFKQTILFTIPYHFILLEVSTTKQLYAQRCHVNRRVTTWIVVFILSHYFVHLFLLGFGPDCEGHVESKHTPATCSRQTENLVLGNGRKNVISRCKS